MNKKLIALAIAAAIAPAAAMADSGNVTIYGVLDASYDLTKTGDGFTARNGATAVSGASANKVSSNSSRVGFKGTEDVGNGLNAVWQIENAINMDGTAGGNLAMRNTYLGLSSKTAGTVLLGRHDTPYKLATRGLDLFADGLADNRNLMGGGGVAVAAGASAAGVATTGVGSVASFDGRQSDVVAYISPTINGMHAAIAYVAGAETVNSNVAGATSKGNAWSMMGMYDNGPLMVSLAYEKHNLGDAGTGTLQAAGNSESEKAWKLGASYTIDAIKLGFAYEKTSDDLGKTGTAPSAGLTCNTGSTGSDCAGHKAWTVSAGYTMGSNMLKAAYTRAGNLGDSTSTGANQWALGVDHNMSKRTKVYAQYVKLSNDSNSAYQLNGAGTNSTGSVTTPGAAAAFGQDPTAFQFGMRHTF